MRIVHITDADSVSGVSSGAYLLHRELIALNISSSLLVLEKNTNDSNVELIPNIRGLSKLFLKNESKTLVSSLNLDKSKKFYKNISKIKSIKLADVLHFHILRNNVLNVSTLKKLNKLNKKIVFTCYDNYWYTGGCYNHFDCQRYKEECGSCPTIYPTEKQDASYLILKLKKKLYIQENIIVTSVSRFLMNEAQESSLFKSSILRYTPQIVDISIFKPSMNIVSKKRYILFGQPTSDSSSWDTFISLMSHFEKNSPEIAAAFEIIIYGDIEYPTNQLKMKINHSGEIKTDQELANLLNMSNVVVIPDLRENPHNLFHQALFCGAPVLTTNNNQIGLLDHKKNGYSSSEGIQGLYNGLIWCIEHRNTIVKEYTKTLHKPEVHIKVIEKYINIYKELDDSND